MKKNLILSLVVAGAMGLMLTGCGNKPEKVTVEVEPTTEVTTEVANPEEQPLIDVEPTTEDNTVDLVIEESGETVVEEQVEVGDVLSELGLEITSCGTMDMEITTGNGDETRIANVTTLIEVVPSEEEGYVDTIFTYTINDAKAFLGRYTMYDRYTGIDLTSATEYDGDAYNVTKDWGSTAVINVDGKEYIVSTSETQDYPADKSIITLTVHHPEEYDGVVFAQLNSNSTQREIHNDDVRQHANLGEEPVLLEGAHFFTATDN